jgi:hypothetical protein
LAVVVAADMMEVCVLRGRTVGSMPHLFLRTHVLVPQSKSKTTPPGSWGQIQSVFRKQAW